MAFGLHIIEDLRDLPVLDHKSCPRHAHHLLAVHILFFHDTVLIGDFFIGVGQQGEIEIELFLELRLGLRGVGRNAENGDALLRELLRRIAKFAGFDGAAGRIGARIEVENDLLSCMVARGRIPRPCPSAL